MAATPKPVRKNIKETESTIRKSEFPTKAKAKDISKKMGESMKKAHKRKKDTKPMKML
jgi:hypothetical protein